MLGNIMLKQIRGPFLTMLHCPNKLISRHYLLDIRSTAIMGLQIIRYLLDS